MSMVKVKLVGCKRYSFKGETFEQGKVVIVSEVKALQLLRSKDDYGRAYFKNVGTVAGGEEVAAVAAVATTSAIPSDPPEGEEEELEDDEEEEDLNPDGEPDIPGDVGSVEV